MLKATLLAASASLILASGAAAQAYRPDIVELTGAADSLAFPPDDNMDLSGGGTIEFWAQPDWTDDPGYDPVVVSNAGPQGASYAIGVTGARDGLFVMAGDKLEIAPFDFTDNKLHYVAVSDYGDDTLVVIDNKPVARLGVTFADLPSDGFWIGTLDGSGAPFKGAVAGLRVWDEPLDPDVLGIYAMQPLVSPAGVAHPAIASLVGMSNFEARSFALAQPNPPPLAEGDAGDPAQ